MDSGKKQKGLVRRITVDEKLSETLIRLLSSPLTAGKSFFSNNEKKWGDEVEMWVTSDTYKKEMGIPPKEDLPKWNDLKEGQVYLSGHFEIVGKRESPEKFKVNTKVKDFLQIDEFVKKDIKELYFKVLKKGK